MSSLLGITETLALLERLRSAVRDAAAKEEKLSTDFRVKSAAEDRAFEAASTRQQAELSESLANAETALDNDLKKGQSKFERRKVRINEAHKAARKQVVTGIGDEEGRRKHRLQENALQAERLRDADLAKATSTRDAFQLKLAQSRDEKFLRLETAARKAFGGYGRFRWLLSPDRSWPEPDLSPNENQVFAELERLHDKIEKDLQSFRRFFLPAVFRFLRVWLFVVLLLVAWAAAPAVLQRFGVSGVSYREAGIGAGVLLALLFAVHFYGGLRPGRAAKAIAGDLARARRLHAVCFEKAEVTHQQEQQRARNEFEQTTRSLDLQWKQTLKGAIDLRGRRPQAVDEKAARSSRKNEQLHAAGLARIQHLHADAVARLQEQGQAQAKQLANSHAAKLAKLQGDHEAQWRALELEWKAAIEPIYEAMRGANAAAEELFPEWQLARWEQWQPPAEFKNAAKFASLNVEVEKFAEAAPKDKRLALPSLEGPGLTPAAGTGSTVKDGLLSPALSSEGGEGEKTGGAPTISLPLVLTYPNQGSIVFETGKTGGEEALAAINNIIFRLLSTAPPGKVSFTIFDPIGLGQSFAGLMHLADYEESHINSRIWTQTGQLEEKLAELNEHMEKVIQMYLRNEYATIAEYNAQAGAVAEKYHFLVIAGFPVNFSDTAARRLLNIAASGARCGVYTLIQWDQRQPLPQDFVPDELRKNSVVVLGTEQGFTLAGKRLPATQLLLDSPPSPDFATQFLHRVGEAGKDSNRVEVPFEQVAPQNSDLWSEETTDELRVPIGRSGATKLQYLAIGKGTRQHALIAGKTGSGKSTLFHVIITNLALWCSPEQVEFYLVDFKKGVEFKCYATRRLPHARVVAIESDRGFGLSVLERVDTELRRRGDLFRQLGVQDLAGYKRAGGTEPIPRSLLMIDEFQEFFVEEDRISQHASVLLDRIVRQGRAFGIHVLLGSQTLGGAYTLARATIGQMVIRIALQCNEADAYLIMDQDNPAPRLLSRPGEGIYNDAAGSIEGNSPFQAVWLSDEVRDRCLARIREQADGNGSQEPGARSQDRYPGPFVFEGNAPADVRENVLLNAALETNPVQAPASARIWLGSPNSIKGPTEAVFRRQSGNNLLIVGQNEESALAIVAVALVSLAAQYPRGAAHFVLLEAAPPGFPHREFLDRVIQAIPHEIIQARNRDLAGIMSDLASDLKQRTSEAQTAAAPTTFVLIHGLQNYKKLRQEDEFSFSGGNAEGAVNPAAVLMDLISEGPSHGLHVIATFDTYNNVGRSLGRKTLGEFETRVLFQMSAGDSASLIDAPDAGTLGMHRALLYNDREGYLETFRPYALPGNDWIERVAGCLGRQAGG